MIKNILYVCTGNTCRSSMAEYLTRKMLQEQGVVGVTVVSQGVAGSLLLQVPETVVKLMQERGIDITPHRSSMVTADKVAEADVVLVMEDRHKQVLALRFPEAKDKTYLMKSYAEKQGSPEIADPIGLNEKGYRRCLEELEHCVFEIVQKIRRKEPT